MAKMALMVNRKVLSFPFFKFPGTPATIGLELGFRFTSPFHSNSSTNRQSLFEKITKPDDAYNLFDEMTRRRPLPSVVQFTQLLDKVTKMKHYSCSIELFKQMCDIGAPVNKYTMSVVIKCYCYLRRTNEAFAVLGSCFKRAVVPHVYIFNALLNGLILEDRISEAERLFKRLIKEEICESDVVTYNTMIKGLCKFGINNTAIALLGLMEERGCKPNVVTYSTIIDSLCKENMIDDALKLFKKMVFHKGIPPYVVTYSSLVHGLCNVGRWDEASQILKAMKDEKIFLDVLKDVQTFNTLVNAFCKKGKVEDTKAVINVMIQRGKSPDVVTYNSLIDGTFSF